MTPTTAGSGPALWTWLVVGAGVAIALGGDLFVCRDARSRGLTWKQTASWVTGCVLVWIVAFPLWFLMRGDYGERRAHASGADDRRQVPTASG